MLPRPRGPFPRDLPPKEISGWYPDPEGHSSFLRVLVALKILMYTVGNRKLKLISELDTKFYIVETQFSLDARQKSVIDYSLKSYVHRPYNIRKAANYGGRTMLCTAVVNCDHLVFPFQEYLDFVAGISTCALGHANAELAAAVGNQAKKLHHVSNLYYIPEQVCLSSQVFNYV